MLKFQTLTIFILFLGTSVEEKELERLVLQLLRRNSGMNQLNGRSFDTFRNSVRNELEVETCYTQKQLKDVLKLNSTKIKPLPKRPKWCNEDGLLTPNLKKPPRQDTPPYWIRTDSFKNSDVFRGRNAPHHSKFTVESTSQDAEISEVILVARDTNYKGSWGRFLVADGVDLICCSLVDKDVARFQSTDSSNKPTFYWVPYEVVDDFEGEFIFQATIIKNPDEYWTNVTSKILNFQPSS